MPDIKCTPYAVGPIPFLPEEKSDRIMSSVPGSLSQEAIDLSEEDIWCMRGVLAALDLVFLYNAEVIAEGILRAINREKLLLVAERDKYHLLGTLREAIHGLK